jgi:phage N-6-adenine-methyltransferase
MYKVINLTKEFCNYTSNLIRVKFLKKEIFIMNNKRLLSGKSVSDDNISLERNVNRKSEKSKRMNVHYSSKTDSWATPLEFFEMLDKEYSFDVDVCATHENAKCAKYFTVEDDGLCQKWTGRCWMNPPYGREIGKWMKKAYETALNGSLVACLVPARTDTKWWHDYASHGHVWLVPGRLKFGDSINSAPFPSALVVFRPSVLNYGRN